VTGTMEPPHASLAEMPDDEIIRRVAEAGADILLVGFGHPKQDLWIAANRHRLPVSVAIGVGGSFDLIAGRLRRAPRWARGSGLEWLYRLAQEPRRLGLRYATCAVWLLGVLVPLAAWQRLAGGDHPPPRPRAVTGSAPSPSAVRHSREHRGEPGARVSGSRVEEVQAAAPPAPQRAASG